MKKLSALRFLLFIFFAFVLFFSLPIKSYAIQQTTGQWVLTGSTISTHGSMPLVTLQDGSVMTVGGSTPSGPQSKVSEVYNISTGQWEQRGNLNIGRDQFVPILLNSRKVIIAGGYDGNSPVSSVEIYDSSTNQWTFTTNLNIPLRLAPTVKLQNGNVLVVSGLSYSDYNIPNAEIFNPSTLEWTSTGNLNQPRIGGRDNIALLNNGNALIVGGSTQLSYSNTVELYNPNTNTWSYTGNLLVPITSTSLIKLNDGRILMIGGYKFDGQSYIYYSHSEIYDPSTGTWSVTGSLNYARASSTSIILSDGKVLVAGGDFAGVPVLQTEIYDPSTGIWTVGGSLIVGQSSSTLAKLTNGQILLANGWNGPPIRSAQLYIQNQSTPLNVPVFRQTDDPWQSQVYDGANFWNPSARTIKRWGCVVTSYAMMLNYFGINRLPNGTVLDPGTLNTWLKNNNGYIDGKNSGYVNPAAISALSKKAKQINNVSFDALEYTQIAGRNTIALTNSINNQIPAILDVGGHFVVAKGINGNTFNINDPYYSDRVNLTSYNNNFNFLGKLTPSSTDVSYIVIAGNQDLHFKLKDSNGNLVGEEYLQEPLVDDESNQPGGRPMQILLVPKPSNGRYSLYVTGNNGKKDIQIYFYDKNGNVKLTKESINLKGEKSQNINIYFDKNNAKKSQINRKNGNDEFKNELENWFKDLFD